MTKAEKECYVLAICEACGHRYPSRGMVEQVTELVSQVYIHGGTDEILKRNWPDPLKAYVADLMTGYEEDGYEE